MCAISLLYDQHNPAAVKMLEAILAAGLFTVCPAVPSPMTMEELNAEMSKAEEEIKMGVTISEDDCRAQRHAFVQQLVGHEAH